MDALIFEDENNEEQGQLRPPLPSQRSLRR